jgi:hypothetical protein
MLGNLNENNANYDGLKLTEDLETRYVSFSGF